MRLPEIFHTSMAIPFWLVFFVAFMREGRVTKGAMEQKDSAQDQGTFRALMFGSTSAVAMSFFVAFLPVMNIPDETLVVWGGIVLIICGALLRRACWAALGESFTGVVQVKPDQAVVQRGPYRLVRHPSYTAAFLMFGGLGLALDSWISLGVLLLVHVYLYGKRVAAEEAALVTTLGDTYRDYMSRTKRYIPFVY